MKKNTTPLSHLRTLTSSALNMSVLNMIAVVSASGSSYTGHSGLTTGSGLK